MTPEQRSLLKHKALTLTALLEGSAPDVIVAQAVYAVFNAGLAYTGTHLAGLLVEDIVDNARMMHRLCQNCDNGIESKLTYKPICEECFAKAETDAAEMEALLKDVDALDKPPTNPVESLRTQVDRVYDKVEPPHAPPEQHTSPGLCPRCGYGKGFCYCGTPLDDCKDEDES